MSGAQAYLKFFSGRSSQIRHIFKRSFSTALFLSILSIKKALWRSGGMLPRKIFENLHTVVVILVLFEQVLGKFGLNFWPLILSFVPNMIHFVRTFSIMRA